MEYSQSYWAKTVMEKVSTAHIFESFQKKTWIFIVRQKLRDLTQSYDKHR